MKKLDDLKLRENTIVIFVGDNGTARYITVPMKDGSEVKGGKAMPIETGTGVPMLASWGKYESQFKNHHRFYGHLCRCHEHSGSC